MQKRNSEQSSRAEAFVFSSRFCHFLNVRTIRSQKRFSLKTSFARTFGSSIQSMRIDDMVAQIDELCQDKSVSELLEQAEHLHVFQRDTNIPGSRGFEPGPSVLAHEIGNRFCERWKLKGGDLRLNASAKPNDLVFDIVLVEPDHWFIGYHFAQTRFQRWPGGSPRIDFSVDVASRAYYKLTEALLWSGLKINPGDFCAEVGASPGGACQALLEKEAKVIAIDPAELDKEIANHPNLTYIRGRGKEVKKKELQNVRWLFSDMNVSPNYTLDTIEDIVTNQHCQRIRGLILTLKITDWKLVEEIPAWKQRVTQWGFQLVKTRQLAFNRKEILLGCISRPIRASIQPQIRLRINSGKSTVVPGGRSICFLPNVRILIPAAVASWSACVSLC